MNIAFAGFRHSHIYALYELAKNNRHYDIAGAYESDKKAIAQAEQNGVFINYDSFESLLSDTKVEIVALGGCFGERGKMAIESLKAGKHVIADNRFVQAFRSLMK